jgi:hypothetical protein
MKMAPGFSAMRFALCSVAGFAAPTLKVVLYVNGTLGDKRSSVRPTAACSRRRRICPSWQKCIDGTYDSSRREPEFSQLCEQDWDLLIARTWQLQEAMEKYAP